jgi:hypothetical protein
MSPTFSADFKNQFLAVWALVMVSCVLKVLEEIQNNTVSKYIIIIIIIKHHKRKIP